MREAHALRAAGRLDDAIGRYGEALAADPASGLAAQGLAQALGDAGRWKEALPHAECAALLEPHHLAAQMTLAEVLLATGEAGRASELAGDIRRRWSTNQRAIALQCDAWRLMGDRRYSQFHDYASLIATANLEPTPEWPSPEAWLGAAAARLHNLHGDYDRIGVDHAAHVFDALPRMMDTAVRRHLENLGPGDDPVRARNRGNVFDPAPVVGKDRSRQRAPPSCCAGGLALRDHLSWRGRTSATGQVWRSDAPTTGGQLGCRAAGRAACIVPVLRLAWPDAIRPRIMLHPARRPRARAGGTAGSRLRSDQSALVARSCDEACEQWMRVERA